MNRLLINLSIFTICLISLIGCSNEAPKEFHLDQLTRVDVQIFTGENNGNELIITEEEKIKILREVFARIDWEQNVMAESSRKEDVKTTLFFTFDKNMPERLFEFPIWFDEGEASALIIDKENNDIGTLNKEDAKILKDILVKD